MFDIVDSTSERVYVIKCRNVGADLRCFEESAEDFIKADNRDMVIDMSEQEVINSLLLASLIRIRRELLNEKRELHLKNCNPHMYRCMEMAGLESFFSFSNYAFK